MKNRKKEATGIHFVAVAVSAAAVAAAAAIIVVVLVVVVLTAGAAVAAAVAPSCLVRIPIVCCPHTDVHIHTRTARDSTARQLCLL